MIPIDPFQYMQIESNSEGLVEPIVIKTAFDADNMRNLRGKGWRDFRLPDVLTVQPFARTVKLSIIRHTGNWKSGLSLDYVRLRRIP
jgi:hypothetical protein